MALTFAFAFVIDAGLPTTVALLLLLLAVVDAEILEESVVFEPEVDVEMAEEGGDVENGATTAGPRSRLARS